MEEKIIEVLRDLGQGKKGIHFDQLYSAVKKDFDVDINQFNELIRKLESTYQIREEDGVFNLPERMGYYIGKLDLNQKGFGFLMVEGLASDIFIHGKYIKGAFQGDICLVKLTSVEKGKNKEGKIVKILERSVNYIVGNVYKKNGELYVKSDNAKHNFEIKIVGNTKNAEVDHKVRVLIKKYVNVKLVETSLIDVIGHVNDPGIDILGIVYQYNIPTVFSDAVIDHAGSIPDEVSEEEIKKRKDLRDQLIVTIDGEEAKDLDDAVTVTKLENGNYKLGVHIADVSYYVKEGTPIDKEAYARGTSVYLVDRVIPMIPHRLSNGICSLNPKVNRLVLSCEMEIDSTGKVVSSDIFESVIKTCERMTYTSVNKILLESDPDECKRYDYLVDMFKDMETLAAILRKKRSSRGSINFETPEARIYVDEQCVPYDIQLRERFVAEKLIEEFMLVANETVAEHISWMGLPFLYRIHEEPKQDKLQQAITIVKNLGFKIKGTGNKIHPNALQGLLDEVQGSRQEKAINTLLLRSMMKAKYSEANLGHYGLASEFYTHFTSPIRRYPDTIVHRLIREFIIEQKVDAKNIEKWEASLPEIGTHTSNQEKEAVNCERDVDSMKKAEFMEDKVGQKFDAIVSSVTSFGLFVELPNTVEGLVHTTELNDDYYEFNEDMMILVGKRKKRVYQLGDQLEVELVRASKADSNIDFRITRSYTHEELEANK